mgnify:CR=1 FL=1
MSDETLQSEWIYQLSIATFDLGIDFPADSFEMETASKVQAKLLELYLVPQSWQSLTPLFSSSQT